MAQFPVPIEVAQSLVDLGARLSLRRRLLELTQADLAQRVGVGLSSIVALEKGSPGVAMGTLARVAWGLEILADLDDVARLADNDPLLQERIDLVPQRVRN